MLSNMGCWKEDWKDPPLPSRDKVDTDIDSDYELQVFITLSVVFSYSNSEKVTWPTERQVDQVRTK